MVCLMRFSRIGATEGSKHITKYGGLAGYSNTDDFAAMAEKYGDIPIDEGRTQEGTAGQTLGKPIENIMNIFDIRLRAKPAGYRNATLKTPGQIKSSRNC